MAQRTDREIDNEIVALKNALSLGGVHHGSRWSVSAKVQLQAGIRVLEDRMTEKQIEREYYVDETMEDYSDGDNDLYNALMLVRSWMNGEEGYDAPSKDLT